MTCGILSHIVIKMVKNFPADRWTWAREGAVILVKDAIVKGQTTSASQLQAIWERYHSIALNW